MTANTAFLVGGWNLVKIYEFFIMDFFYVKYKLAPGLNAKFSKKHNSIRFQ